MQSNLRTILLFILMAASVAMADWKTTLGLTAEYTNKDLESFQDNTRTTLNKLKNIQRFDDKMMKQIAAIDNETDKREVMAEYKKLKKDIKNQIDSCTDLKKFMGKAGDAVELTAFLHELEDAKKTVSGGGPLADQLKALGKKMEKYSSSLPPGMSHMIAAYGKVTVQLVDATGRLEGHIKDNVDQGRVGAGAHVFILSKQSKKVSELYGPDELLHPLVPDLVYQRNEATSGAIWDAEVQKWYPVDNPEKSAEFYRMSVMGGNALTPVQLKHFSDKPEVVSQLIKDANWIGTGIKYAFREKWNDKGHYSLKKDIEDADVFRARYAFNPDVKNKLIERVAAMRKAYETALAGLTGASEENRKLWNNYKSMVSSLKEAQGWNNIPYRTKLEVQVVLDGSLPTGVSLNGATLQLTGKDGRRKAVVGGNGTAIFYGVLPTTYKPQLISGEKYLGTGKEISLAGTQRNTHRQESRTAQIVIRYVDLEVKLVSVMGGKETPVKNAAVYLQDPGETTQKLDTEIGTVVYEKILLGDYKLGAKAAGFKDTSKRVSMTDPNQARYQTILTMPPEGGDIKVILGTDENRSGTMSLQDFRPKIFARSADGKLYEQFTSKATLFFRALPAGEYTIWGRTYPDPGDEANDYDRSEKVAVTVPNDGSPAYLINWRNPVAEEFSRTLEEIGRITDHLSKTAGGILGGVGSGTRDNKPAYGGE